MEFHRLLDAVVGEKWHCKSPTCDWTMGEVLLHLTGAREQLPEEVASAWRGKGMFNMIQSGSPTPGSYLIIRWRRAIAIQRRCVAAMTQQPMQPSPC